MIHTSRTVTVGKMESVINEPIMLYRGDREVEIEFDIVGSKFMFSNGGNVIKSTNATNGQLVINTPTGENMFSEVTECNDGKVVCVITKEMIDELAEVGFYSFQIRLFDESQVSRVTIPPVYQGIEIRNPIAAEDETDLVDIGLVDFSVVRKDNYENVVTFLPNGDYNKTLWEEHDVISKDRLNKVEDALYEINKGTEGLYPTFQNQYDEFSAKVNKDVKAYKEEIEDEVEQFERDMTQAFGEFKVDYEDEVHDRLDVVEGELAQKVDVSNLNFVNVKDFGVVGDGQTDDTSAIQYILDNSNIKTIYFPRGKYKITNTLKINRSGLKIIGDTKYHSRIVNTSNCDAVHIMENCERGVLKDIAIFGDGETVFAPHSTTKKGIVFFNFACQWYIENVWMRGHGEEFIYICGDGHVNNIYILNSEFEYGKTNCMKIYQNSVDNQINAIHIKDCCISGFGGDCIQLWGQSLSVQNCAIQNSKGRGIVIDGILPDTDILNGSHARSITIANNYFELINQEMMFFRSSYTPHPRYIDGLTVENNYGFYTKKDEFNSDDLYLVKVITPDYSRFTRMFNGFTYRANSFDIEGCKGELDAGNCNNTNSIFISNRLEVANQESEKTRYKKLGNANVFGRAYGYPIELFGKTSCVSHSFNDNISEVVGNSEIVFQLPCSFNEINRIQIDIYTTSSEYNFSVLGVRNDNTTNPITHTFKNNGNTTQIVDFTNATLISNYKSIILKCSHVVNNNDTKVGNLIIYKR